MSPPRSCVYLFMNLHHALWKCLAPEKEADVLPEKPMQQMQRGCSPPEQTSSIPFTPFPAPTQPICAKCGKGSPPCNSRMCKEGFTMATPSTSSPGNVYKGRQAHADAPLWTGSCWSPCLSPSSECGRTPVKGNQEMPRATRLPPT